MNLPDNKKIQIQIGCCNSIHEAEWPSLIISLVSNSIVISFSLIETVKLVFLDLTCHLVNQIVSKLIQLGVANQIVVVESKSVSEFDRRFRSDSKSESNIAILILIRLKGHCKDQKNLLKDRNS